MGQKFSSVEYTELMFPCKYPIQLRLIPCSTFTVISSVMQACKTYSAAIIFLSLKHADVKSGSPICPWFWDAFFEIASLQWLNALFLSIAPGVARKLTRK